MNFDKEMQRVLIDFTVESADSLQDMENGLMALEHLDDYQETVNAIFRAAHTIKGTAGLFGLDHIVRFAHVLESVLDRLRAGELPVSAELVNALLPCCDHLTMLIRDVANGRLDENHQYSEQGNQLHEALLPFLETQKGACAPDGLASAGHPESEPIATGNWHLFLHFHENCLRDGMDPLSFLRYLKTLGEIVELTTFGHAIPEAASMDPESSYLGFEIVLKSEASKADIEEVFDFVRGGSHIHILPLESKIDYYVELIDSLTEDSAHLNELLIKSGVITLRELEAGFKAKKRAESQPPAPRIGEILAEQPLKDGKARENQSIRVDAERLDKLIDLIGELVIATAAANLRARQIDDVALQEANAGVIGLVETVRDSALQLRMVPIGTTFNRFQRVVRDVSKELGKDIRLEISGAETEIDKSVVERISDPLMHLVRNAMDHGIERAEVRTECGKAAQGTLRLNAYHSSGNIVIEVSDDGGGLDRDKIFAKAVERALIQPDAVLSDQEIHALIFEPGFSTADQVSNLSGRGVGMDVVKRNISELRGNIHIDSHRGRGATIKIHLPLTLAIIDGFLANVSDAAYVIPLDRVVECVALPVDDGHDYMELRGEVLPFIRLHQLFDKKGRASRRQNVIVVEHLGLKAGLIVDRLLGELQTVIKPLGKLFDHVQGVSGSTILGSGEVALILDVPLLMKHCEHRQQESFVLPHAF